MTIPKTIKYPETFDKSQCQITCPNCACEFPFVGIFDWWWVIQAIKSENIKSKITPMDFDGVIERNNHFLVFETKDEGVKISRGQQITLEALQNAKSFYVMKIWGKSQPKDIEISWYYNDKLYTEKSHGIGEAMRYVSAWYNWANTH
jgi:hypothetical protein